jgi:hypothetical protein
MRKAKLSTKVLIAVVLALVLLFAVTGTALAHDSATYKFDSSKFSKADMAKWSAALHVNLAKVGWCNIDFKHFDWTKILAWLKDHKFCWKPVHPPTTCTTHKPPCSTTDTTESPVTSEPENTTAAAIETGGGGTSGPGTGIWALGILALALAGGLTWTAVRPAARKK